MSFNFFKTSGITHASRNKLPEAIKKKAHKRWNKQEKEANNSYQRTVKEAVVIIKNKWESSVDAKYPTDSIELKAKNSFLITAEGLKLYFMSTPEVNPDTVRSYFYIAFQFSSEEMIKQFIDDILYYLPDETEYTSEEIYEVAVSGKVTTYEFKLKIDMQ